MSYSGNIFIAFDKFCTYDDWYNFFFRLQETKIYYLQIYARVEGEVDIVQAEVFYLKNELHIPLSLG